LKGYRADHPSAHAHSQPLHSKLVREETYQVLYDESRFALLKLILNRNRKDTDMELKPELTADTTDAAYNCGRLLSVFNETQKKAHEYGLKGATVSEKYFGTAQHLASLCFSVSGETEPAYSRNRQVGQLLGDERFLRGGHILHLIRLGQTEEMRRNKISPAFPRTLDLQAQGRFALGFYQQMAADDAARRPTERPTSRNLNLNPSNPIPTERLNL